MYNNPLIRHQVI